MGQQVGFYAIDKDYDAFIQFIRESGFLGVPEIIPSDSLSQGLPLEKLAYADRPFFYLIPEEVSAAEAFYKELSDDPHSSKLLVHVSPVIELQPCKRQGDAIYDGRIYIGLGKEDRYYDLLLKKYRKLARYVRKWDRTDQFSFCVGPHTAEMAKEGQIKLMHHQIELKVA